MNSAGYYKDQFYVWGIRKGQKSRDTLSVSVAKRIEHLKLFTDILRMDLNSRKVRCSASSIGSRWSNSSEALPFLACFFRWVSLRIQSYDGLQGEQNIQYNSWKIRDEKNKWPISLHDVGVVVI